MLEEPLRCLHCDEPLSDMPELKEHLQEHFDEKIHKAEAQMSAA